MSYPAGAPLPSSKIILIILDGNMSDGIVPEYLENKSLSKSFVKIISLFLKKFSTVENLFSFSNQSEINIIKFSNIAIVFGTFKNIEFNKSTDIIIPVTLKNVSVMATPWHTGTPGNLTIMSYGEKNKITIRANNNGTNLTTVSGTFIAIGTM